MNPSYSFIFQATSIDLVVSKIGDIPHIDYGFFDIGLDENI